MKFDVISDMHIEMNDRWSANTSVVFDTLYYPWESEKKSDILIIAGDCSNSPKSSLRVIDDAATIYDRVIWLTGNHEHYSNSSRKSTVDADNELFRNHADNNNRVTYLDNGLTEIIIDGVLFIGANGWYDWTANQLHNRETQHSFWKTYMNDAKCIRFNLDEYPDKLAKTQADRLRERVTEAQDDDTITDIIVTTHTIPERELCLPDTHQLGYLNGSYVNMHMTGVANADINHKIKLWIFGHTHFHYDQVIGHIRYVNNARGYYANDIYRRENKFSGIKQVDTSEIIPQSAFGDIE